MKKCAYHPARDEVSQCSRCLKSLCSECVASRKDGASLCKHCEAIQAGRELSQDILKDRADNEAITSQQRLAVARQRKSLIALQILVVLAALVILAFQLPGFFQAIEPEPPLRIGSNATGPAADECISVLWLAAKKLQEGSFDQSEMVCPGSDKPLELVTQDGEQVVRVPDPQRYGFREMRVSKKRPIPEVIR